MFDMPWMPRKWRMKFSLRFVLKSLPACSVLWKGSIYGFDESELKCIASKDGSEQWGQKNLGKGSLIMSADGRLIVTSEKGELAVVKAEPNGYTELARAQILSKTRCWTVPTLANGRIYMRNAKGEMACLDVSP